MEDSPDSYEEVWLGENFLSAAKLDCSAKIKEAAAQIGLYLSNTVAIGDHPNIMEEIIKAAESGSHAQDVLNFLEERW